jgi:hypothetical protein
MYWGEDNTYGVSGEKPDGKGQLGRLGIEGRIRLKWISTNRMGGHGPMTKVCVSGRLQCTEK